MELSSIGFDMNGIMTSPVTPLLRFLALMAVACSAPLSAQAEIAVGAVSKVAGRAQIDAATANGQFDEAVVRSLASQQAQLQADQMVDHLRIHSKLYSLLTAEQKAKADELMKQHGGPGHGPGGHGHHGGPPPAPGF